ncbi:MAG: MFS transporter [Gluconacetobacter diazotrophicus]|nr:MFS transporter [Gluconacetobacter diazotrophicus]
MSSATIEAGSGERDRSGAAGRLDAGRPSSRSLLGLDGVNFLMADVRDGVGPYLSVFLAGTRHWQPGAIGVAMAASHVAAAICQVPAGLLVDATRHKRLLVALSGLVVGLGCLLIVTVHGFWPVIAAQALLGAASAVIPPALAALSLGIVGRRLMPARISRNESFNHAGSFAAAGLAGAFGQYLSTNWIFYLVCGFAIASAIVARLIDPREVDHELARGCEEKQGDGSRRAVPINQLLRRRDVTAFLGTVFLFHFGNAAMLPFAGQVLAKAHPGTDTVALSACIICAQLVMVGVAWGVGRAMKAGIGRKPIFALALLILPVRGVLFSFTSNPLGVVAIQLLDGVAAGIFGVIAVIIAADLTRGTGRFNLMQGMVALAVGIGGSLSNVVGGYVAEGAGFPTAFLFLAAVAAAATALFLLLMPETGRNDEAGEEALAATEP